MSIEQQRAAVSGLFGADDIEVQRALAEFRAGRPILVACEDDRLAVLAVDGASAQSIAAFRAACAPLLPSLVVTSRRARSLGLDEPGPVALTLAPQDKLEAIWALATSIRGVTLPTHCRAGPAAVAAVHLAKLAQLVPALLVADASQVPAIAVEPRVISVTAAAIARFRENLIASVKPAGRAQVPLQEGVAACFHVFRDGGGGSPAAIVIGEPDFTRPVPVRLHSACLTGDVFGSRRCDCGAQLQLAITRLTASGGGVILYLEQEGRGLGLANKMRAYALQDAGLDTVDANTALGFDDDERDYGVAARMLQLIGCNRVLLMTNNPDKLEALAQAGIDVAGRVPLYTPINADNRRYLAAKAARAGHWLDQLTDRADGEESERLEPTSGP